MNKNKICQNFGVIRDIFFEWRRYLHQRTESLIRIIQTFRKVTGTRKYCHSYDFFRICLSNSESISRLAVNMGNSSEHVPEIDSHFLLFSFFCYI